MDLISLLDQKKITLFSSDDSDVILGRGPLLKISDITMSRNVAKIAKVCKLFEFSSGKKGAFYYEEGSIKSLTPGEKRILKNGDKIALDKDGKFSYEVRMEESKATDICAEESKSKEVGRRELKPNEVSMEEPKSNKVGIEETNGTNIEDSNFKETGNEESTSKDTRMKDSKPEDKVNSRVLPAWMMDLADEEKEEQEVKQTRRKDDKQPIKRSPPSKKPSPAKSHGKNQTKIPVHKESGHLSDSGEDQKISPAKCPSPAPKNSHHLSDSEAEEEKNQSTPVKKKKANSTSPIKNSHNVSDSEEDEKDYSTPVKRKRLATPSPSSGVDKSHQMSDSGGETPKKGLSPASPPDSKDQVTQSESGQSLICPLVF